VANDPYRYFRVEARDLLDRLGKGVMELERRGSPGEAVPRLLRFAHTLKGAARVVKQAEIATLAHEIEDRLEPFREGREAVPREGLDTLLEILDAMGARLTELVPPPDSGAPPAVEEPFRTLRTDVGEMDHLLDGIAATQAGLGSLRRAPASLARARRLVSLVEEDMSSPRARASVRPGRRAAETAVQDLRDLLVGIEHGLTGDVERIESEIAQARAAGERLRLLPVDTLFGPLERAVRDTARAAGKRAAFRGEGGETRLDGHVLAALQGALVQVVRNAVAHGIETEPERVAAGKPEEGSVVVEVVPRGARVAFTCRDDGRGVDLGAVRRALQRKGALPAEDIDPDRLLQLLLDGGISTSRAVTDVSGRGVGLDVVREVVARLGGNVTIGTKQGEGTTLELVVPVSLSSLDALIVEASGARAALPVEAVRRTIRVSADDIARSGDGDSIAHEGQLVPFLPLARLLGRESRADPGRSVWSAVVLAGRSGLAALGVERLLGRSRVLVRPLPALASFDPIVVGASLGPEGDPQPVLDSDRLAEAVRRAERKAPSPEAPTPPILIVDDSLTTRMLEQSILESAGYAVELASSGEEALEKARRRRFSLFLVDIEMPGMDGFALLEHLRSDPALRKIPAVLVTSRTGSADRVRGTELGARAFIVKSEFDQGDLLERIRVLVE
jgi:two-component system, chemotaxis family, sensor kinase CheA